MSVAGNEIKTYDAMLADVDAVARKTWRWTIGAFVLIGVYLLATFVQFDLGNIAKKWNADRAALFLLDTYAYKDHVTMRWDEPDEIIIAFEGGFRQRYTTPPEWFTTDPDNGGRVVNFENDGKIIFFNDRVLMADWPGTNETFTFVRDASGKPAVLGYEGRSEALPDWMRVTENKIEVRPTLYERLQVYGTKVEVHRYEIGWNYFWFDFDSPLRNVTPIEAIGLMFSGDRVDPEQSNASLIWREFLDNDQWHHGTVWFALLETVLMALIGTLIAVLVALPLAFLAAYNVTRFQPLRFLLRRLFDFLRGVDTLIWSLIFLRAFGPGVFTGIFAIAFTDTGTLGKLLSEAIENADNKQREGVKSTGASPIQVHRFGIVPQVMPVIISQSLYYLESNTRSAVIIGAMGAGGIGLQFLGALQTGNDFENVAYMALLVLITVILMDQFSARLRRALIGIEEPSRERTRRRALRPAAGSA